MQKQTSPKITALVFFVLTITLLAAFYAIAWQDPISSPPDPNVDKPINVGTDPQAKQGRVSATEFYDYNDPSYYINPSGSSNIDTLCFGPADCRSSWSAGGGALAFYTRTKTSSGAVSLTAYCNCGDEVTGGGGRWDAYGTYDQISKPVADGNGWLCNGRNALVIGGPGTTKECYAVCANTTISSEGCDNCWEGSQNYTLSPDSYDQNCNSAVDDYTPPYSKTCSVSSGSYSSILKSGVLSACRIVSGGVGPVECTVTCSNSGFVFPSTSGYNFSTCSTSYQDFSYSPGDPFCDPTQPITCDCPGYYQ